ncbi:MAG: nicotinate-nucleotide adenylyltransferase [Syntrophorhabdaceae bacterium]|nr:nicotinate-nucleotide adenylyltransferase [Syntrophorhabdaceae bacterium]MDD4195638.1 nicotinate-nucleotide adenylyltransferase [Syntrophorhabdaceae bacterium]HOC46447.1 nicotinate-nucleotide adenylyltransferase [Syntrophorhabdaceae bacterium]
MAIGVFGGTFNPVHMGHLRVAEEIREDFRLEVIYFIPSHLPPHKDTETCSFSGDRLKMLEAAVKGNPFFKVSDLEIKRGGLSYTIETLKKLEGRFNDIYFIIGIDAFVLIDTWYHWEELFYHTNFIVMTRPASGSLNVPQMLPESVRTRLTELQDSVYRHESGKTIHLHPVTKIDISSTKIRALHREERSIKYLVPPSVEKIIIERGLYRS